MNKSKDPIVEEQELIERLKKGQQWALGKNQVPVFQTQVLLKNHNSITIGDPQYQKGVLLLNFKGDVR